MYEPISLLFTAYGDYIGRTRTIILFADGTTCQTGSEPAILAHLVAGYHKTENRLLACVLEATREQAGVEPSGGGHCGY